MSRISPAKKRAARHALGLAGSAVGLVMTVRKLREARSDRDGLAVLNHVIRVASIVTGVVLTVRSIRRGEPDGKA